jgi:hypothetical protein
MIFTIFMQTGISTDSVRYIPRNNLKERFEIYLPSILSQIEANYCSLVLNITLELRPNYHSKDERIRCHIFLCFLALVLARIAEHKTGSTWTSIRQEMSRLQLGTFLVGQKKVSQLTELTPQQKLILKQLGIKEPAAIVDIQ